MRIGPLLDRIPPAGWLAIGVLATALAFRLGLGASPAGDVASIVAPSAAEVDGSLAGYRVRLASDSLVEIAPTERPAVVMVSSVSCAVCAEAMSDLASDGAPLPALRIVTLEGAEMGGAMARRQGLRGVWHAGPTDGAATLLTFIYPGTPTFLLVEPGGRVRKALVGYPGREAFAPWARAMAGERSSL